MAKKEHKGLMLAFMKCTDPARDGEFNDWYNKTHIPDVLHTPGILSATRYVNARDDDADRKYITIYEIEGEDVGATFKAMRETMQARKAKMIDFFKITSGINFKRIL